jgi:hypothetical protein
MLAWFCWGVLILGIRYYIERRHEEISGRESQQAVEA